MQKAIPAGTSFWVRRLVRTTAALGLLLVLGFAQSGFAQAPDPPLTFGNNFFVTGDYVVAGAYGLGVNAPAVNGFATGTINVPDKDPVTGKMNPGITGVTSVPAGAEIVAALLYWQTIEKSNQLGTGQNGFFRPLFAGGPQTGYPISGATASQNTVSFSGGGCTGSSGGKVVRTYRASVRGFLPQDAKGNVLANSTYEVRLPNDPNAGLPTLGATLVIIYRVVSPDVPLNSIVIYDGSFAPGNNLLNMTQTVQGFYQAAQNPVSRLTHIVGNGHNYKFQKVYLNDNVNALPNLYPSGQPFPGYYGSWDNTTWTFDPNKTYVNFPNPVKAGDSSATTTVVPNMSQGGCVSWGAVIVSTTVQNSDGDGLLDVWKTKQGYCDAAVNEGSCTVGNPSTGWVDLTGAAPSQKDVFVQLDYMCSVVNPDGTCATNTPFCSTLNMDGTCNTAGGYSFDPRLTVDPMDGKNVVDKVVSAFSSSPNPIHLHVIPTNAIPETTCTDDPKLGRCVFPNQPGVVGWKGGLIFLKNQLFDPDDAANVKDCATSPPAADCKPRFQHGRKDSYHYALFAHTLGLPSWTLVAGTLTSVVQSGTTVTFTTSTPHGLVMDSLHPGLGNGRVTIESAATNPNLNGTQLVTGVSPTGVLTITQTSMDASGVATYTSTQSSGTAPVAGDFVTVKNTTNGNGIFNVVNATIESVTTDNLGNLMFTVNAFPPVKIAAQSETGDVPPASAQTAHPPFTFKIDIGTSASSAPSYTLMTDPYLAVASGQADEVSGFSDVGGQDSVIALGSWLANGVTWQVKAGTLMHELGHSLGLTHGGFYYDNLAINPRDYTPTIEANCKPNHQSVMNYLFQVDLLDNGTGFNVLDYSGQTLIPLDESAATSNPLVSPTYLSTSWYGPTVVGTPATEHCDGTPILDRARMSRMTGLTGSLSWSTNQDINFNGIIETALRGHNDWASIDPRQIGATGSLTVLGSGGLAGGAGGLAGGAGGLAGGAGGLAGGAGGLAGGAGGLAGGAGGKHGELTQKTASSVTRPPRRLTATEDVSPRFIHLFWFPSTFGQIGTYNIYRQPPWVAGNPPTFSVPVNSLVFHTTGPHAGQYEFIDTTATCNPSGYTYFVTAVLASNSTNPGQESAPSNTVSTGQNGEKLTGCYGPTGFNLSLPANAVQGSKVSITWTVQDASNKAGFAVPISTVNTLVVSGPLPNSCATMGDTTILANGMLTAQSGALSAFSQPNPGQYMFNLDTDGFCAGQYTVKLILDNQLALSSHQMAMAPLQLQIDVTDTDTTPHITTTALTPGTVGVLYSNTLTQDGGVGTLTWTVVVPGTGSLPSGILLGANSGTLSGIPCALPGSYTFTAKVMDSAGNSGMQDLTLNLLAAPVAQINQPTAPESSAPLASAFPLTVNGTGFDTCSQVQWNGSALTTVFKSATQLMTTIPSTDVVNPGTSSVSVAKIGSPTSNVDFFQITNSTGSTVFLSGAATAVGANPIGLISADFNGDGKPDLAVANSGGNTVSILLGNADGTFTPTTPPTLATGKVPNSLTAGDFNNDGKLDLAVTNSTDGTVSIFISNGGGTFKPGVTYAVGSGPTFVVTGDFNGDGKLDLAVVNQNDHTVSILLGNGDGTFQTQVVSAAVLAGSGTLDAADVAIGDFNGDGKLDLAVTNPGSDQVSILLGNGNGTFQNPVSYSTGASGSHPVAVTAADFNGDGVLDLAVTNLNNRSVAIFLGSGNGTFTLNASYPTTIGLMSGPSAITSGDFNGDGKVDLAITDQGDDSVSILVGNGNGTFQSPQEVNTSNNHSNLTAGVAAGDFNGDGRLDVAVANSSDGTVSVMLQAPRVQLAPSPVPSFGTVAVSSTSSPPQVVTLTNTGSAALSITQIAIGGTNLHDFSQNNNCPTSPNTLAAGSNCTINVTFAPTQAGARSATLMFTDNASDSPQSLSLSGTGVLAPPTNLTATTTAGSGSVSLSWTGSPSGTVVSYNVYRSTTSGGPYTPIKTGLAATSYVDIVASGTYFYVVAAVDASSNVSANSNEVMATD